MLKELREYVLRLIVKKSFKNLSNEITFKVEALGFIDKSETLNVECAPQELSEE